MSQQQASLKKIAQAPYRYGFISPLKTKRLAAGLSEKKIRQISALKKEPAFLLKWRLAAYKEWKKMSEPTWADLNYPSINYDKLTYYAAAKKADKKSLNEVDPELRRMFDKLGIPLWEQKKISGVAIDAVVDSASVATTFSRALKKQGIIFCSFNEAVQKYPALVKKYLGSVVGPADNFFAALNAAVFSDGSFCYIPKKVKCPLELSTYFRINASGTGQFERTLIIAEEDSLVSYLEGCTAPRRDEHQLHAAVVEIVAQKNAQVKYATVQNWYPGDEQGRGGVYNFVTKRGKCLGDNSKISWTQVETGSAVTWKYPSVILAGDNSVGEFYSLALTKNFQQADTGSKMVHLGRNTCSTIIAKSVAAGHSRSTYRGAVRMPLGARSARNVTQCDSLLLGDNCQARTVPTIEVANDTAQVEHEAYAAKVSAEQLYYCQQRGLDREQALGLIVNGFCHDIFKRLPLEFAAEAQNLLSLSLEGVQG